jgi:hypothetical protein
MFHFFGYYIKNRGKMPISFILPPSEQSHKGKKHIIYNFFPHFYRPQIRKTAKNDIT